MLTFYLATLLRPVGLFTTEPYCNRAVDIYTEYNIFMYIANIRQYVYMLRPFHYQIALSKEPEIESRAMYIFI